MFWKVIFWIALLMGGWNVIGVTGSFAGDFYQDIGSVIGAALSFLALVSIYGFAYKKAIGWRWLAISTFSLNLISVVFVSYVLGWWAALLSGEMVTIVFATIGFGMLWLYFCPQYGYAFKSNELWSGDA